MKEFRNASNRLCIDLGDDGPMFQEFVRRLKDRCRARLMQRLEGLDQRYYDFEVDGAVVVLHSDAQAGISIHIEDESRDDLLRRIAAQVNATPTQFNAGSDGAS